MSRPSPDPRRRAPFAVCLVALAAATVSGCSSTGVGAQTNAQYQAGVGANVSTGAIRLYHALAVDNGDESATVSVTILNTSTKAIRLTSADARTTDGKKLQVTTAPAIIDADETMATGPAGAIIVKGPGLAAGGYVALTLRFSGGRKVSVDAPVVARSDVYEDVATGPGGETATPTPSQAPESPAEAPAAGSDELPLPGDLEDEPAGH